MFCLLEGEGALKHKYHLKGIGGRPSKQMKEMQKKPLPTLLFALIPENIPCKPNQNLIKPSKNP